MSGRGMHNQEVKMAITGDGYRSLDEEQKAGFDITQRPKGSQAETSGSAADAPPGTTSAPPAITAANGWYAAKGR